LLLPQLHKPHPKPPDIDPFDKIALKPFPQWNPNSPRSDFAPDLSCWKDRKPEPNVR